MNHIYKVVRNRAGRFVVTGETAKSNVGTSEKNAVAKTAQSLALVIGAFIAQQSSAGEICDYVSSTAQTSSAGGGTNLLANAFACGLENVALAPDSVAMGIKNRSQGEWSSAIGYQNEARTVGSSAIGYQNKAMTYDYASAIGYKNEATGGASSAFGNANFASAQLSNAFGSNNYALGADSNAIGNANRASQAGKANSAIGRKNLTIGETGAAVGSRNSTVGKSSTALGSSVEDYNTIAPLYQRTVTPKVENGQIVSVNGITVTASSLMTSSITHINGRAVTVEERDAFLENLKYGNVAVGDYSSAVGVRNLASGLAAAGNDANSAMGALNDATGG